MPETSPVNQSKRMVKKQQMRWSPREVRTPDPHPGYSTTTLADDYRRWYPGFTHTDGRTRRMASHGLSRSPARHHADEPCATQAKPPSHRRPSRHRADQSVDSRLHRRRCLQSQIQRRSTTGQRRCWSSDRIRAAAGAATCTVTFMPPWSRPRRVPPGLSCFTISGGYWISLRFLILRSGGAGCHPRRSGRRSHARWFSGRARARAERDRAAARPLRGRGFPGIPGGDRRARMTPPLPPPRPTAPSGVSHPSSERGPGQGGRSPSTGHFVR